MTLNAGDRGAEMFVCDMTHPRDVSGLTARFDAGVDPHHVTAIVGKTIGGGLADDFGRELTELALLGLLAERTGTSVEAVAARVPIILSGGAVGVITPHVTMFTRPPLSAEAPDQLTAGPADVPAGRLTIGCAFSADIPGEEIGRRPHVEKVAAAVSAAMTDAGVSDPADVHCVLVKAPSLNRRKILDAHARGRTVVTQELAPGERGAGEYANDASCLGVAWALGEVAAEAIDDTAIRHRWDLYSSRAHASCGAERTRADVCVLANSAHSRSRLRVGHGLAPNLVSPDGVSAALQSAGLALDSAPSSEQLERIVQVFAHPVIPDGGVLFGQATPLWEDPDAVKTTKAVVGAIVASVVCRTSIYVSGGEHNSHQGPPGGYPVAAVVRAD